MIFDPARIEQELSQIMVRNSPTEARASLLNLVVFSTADSKPQADAMLDAVLGKRAARVIHITGSESPESDVTVSARCYIDHSNRSVCLQEVVISNGRDGIGAAVSSWAPLLIRDIPVYVVWLDAISHERDVLAKVVELADTLVLDSELTLRIEQDQRRLFARLSDLSHNNVALCDIAWHRVLPLCAVTADGFDNPQLQQQIESIAAVELDGAPPQFAALYLGWFASRLELRAAEDVAPDGSAPLIQWNLSAAENRRVRLWHAAARPIEDGMQVNIRFSGAADLQIRALPGGCAEVEDESESSTCVLPQPSDGEILLKEIDGMRHDHIYTETVRRIDTFM